MNRRSLRNTVIIIGHEYFQRVRTKSFLFTTLLMPAFMGLIIGLPALAAGRQAPRVQNVVLVCADSGLAELITNTVSRNTQGTYQVRVDGLVSDAERARLTHELNTSQIDGYIWMDADAISNGKIQYVRRTSADVIGQQLVRDAISSALSRQRLAQHGVPLAQAETLLKGVQMDSVSIGTGKERRESGIVAIVTVFIFVFVLFITLLSYGVMVMRSVLEEKASRVMEILLCSTTSGELMAGKILGVGAVGLTQVGIWAAIGVAIASPKAAAAINLPFSFIFYFGLFYLLGYLLYSAMFAAVGAAFNSADEAQQWNFVIISPLIVASTLMTPVASSPSSGLAIFVSMIPFCAPVLMYLRIVVERPPAWQIALSVAILVASIFFAMNVAARVYRVGILMYGKRPSLRELFRWLRYA